SSRPRAARRRTSHSTSRRARSPTGRGRTGGRSRAGRSRCRSGPRRRSCRCTPRSTRRRVRYKNTTSEPADSARPRNADYVQSLARGLSVIRAFDADHRELGLSEVARATGLTRAAARRFLLTLVELGFAYLSSLSLPEVAEPHMEALVAQINESSSLSVLDDTDVVYVARV